MFQSPSPRGGRLYDTRFTKQFFKFQSPFPSQGTTAPNRLYFALVACFNPHPHKGDDTTTPLNIHGGYWFQSPFPVRGTTILRSSPSVTVSMFQSPFPVRGTTTRTDNFFADGNVSIPVPREGNDAQNNLPSFLVGRFNPRSP